MTRGCSRSVPGRGPARPRDLRRPGQRLQRRAGQRRHLRHRLRLRARRLRPRQLRRREPLPRGLPLRQRGTGTARCVRAACNGDTCADGEKCDFGQCVELCPQPDEEPHLLARRVLPERRLRGRWLLLHRLHRPASSASRAPAGRPVRRAHLPLPAPSAARAIASSPASSWTAPAGRSAASTASARPDPCADVAPACGPPRSAWTAPASGHLPRQGLRRRPGLRGPGLRRRPVQRRGLRRRLLPGRPVLPDRQPGEVIYDPPSDGERRLRLR